MNSRACKYFSGKLEANHVYVNALVINVKCVCVCASMCVRCNLVTMAALYVHFRA